MRHGKSIGDRHWCLAFVEGQSGWSVQTNGENLRLNQTHCKQIPFQNDPSPSALKIVTVLCFVIAVRAQQALRKEKWLGWVTQSRSTCIQTANKPIIVSCKFQPPRQTQERLRNVKKEASTKTKKAKTKRKTTKQDKKRKKKHLWIWQQRLRNAKKNKNKQTKNKAWQKIAVQSAQNCRIFHS